MERRQVYRSPTHMLANVALASVMTLATLGIVLPVWPDLSWIHVAIGAGVGGLLLWFWVARVLLAAVRLDPDGVTIVDPFWTRRLAWSEIGAFGFGRFGRLFPRVGWVELGNGERLMIWAIQGSVFSSANRSSRRLIDALNEELRHRDLPRSSGTS